MGTISANFPTSKCVYILASENYFRPSSIIVNCINSSIISSSLKYHSPLIDGVVDVVICSVQEYNVLPGIFGSGPISVAFGGAVAGSEEPDATTVMVSPGC